MKHAPQRCVNSRPSSRTETRAELPTVDPIYIALDDSAQEEQGPSSVHSEKMRGKKRKTFEEDIDSNSGMERLENAPKKPRLDPGSCTSTFVDIIEDVQLQIMEFLNPIDLLNLARTNKNINGLVNGSTSTWKKAFARFPGLPECPTDFTPLEYADLMFGKDCQFCRKKLPNKSMHTNWSARIRACKECLKLKWIHSPKPVYPMMLYKCLPWIDIGGKQMALRYYYDRETHDSWQTGWENSANKDVWTTEKVKEWKARIEHGDACKKWAEAVQRDQDLEEKLKVETRRALILEHLQKQEWADELQYIGGDQVHPIDTKEVTKACQTPVTKKSLSKTLSFLKGLLEKSKADRLKRERGALLAKSLPILSKILEEYSVNCPLDALYPNVCELVLDPHVKDILDTTPLAELCVAKFQLIIPLFPVIISRWNERIDAKLVQLIKDGCRRSGLENTFDPEKVLQLATTTFSCAYCNSRCDGNSLEQAISYPRVLMHSCAYKPKLRRDEDADELIMHDTLRQGYWNARGDITFNLDNLKILTEALKVCGLDPKSTTVAEIEATSPILECNACSDGYTGRVLMEWLTVPTHCRQKHSKDFLMELALLEDTGTLEAARQRMLEERERRISRRNYHGMTCIHCRQKGNLPSLIDHVNKIHGISTPGRQDIGYVFDSDQATEVCHLWPPRYVNEKGCAKEIALRDISRRS